MCGIAGAFSPGATVPDRASVGAALASLESRGPDDHGIWSAPGVVLGHRRLAVIDLTASGHQPMVSADGRYAIVFNGEIYNHAELRRALDPPDGWRGGSDTETLLEAFRQWGTDCLQRLTGMFAFAIWDSRERRLVLARDRLGKKPLYYSSNSAGTCFASRPSALAPLLDAAALSLDLQGVRCFLELGFIPAPLSLQRGICKLPPAHFAVIDARGLRCVRYWDFRHLAADPDLGRRSDDDLADELEALLRDAVRARLLSDVPLGTFLSGGVDSAMVLAMMRAAGAARPQAFTIGFDDPAYDESAAAARIATHLGADHVVETLQVDSLVELLPDYVRAVDEPMADVATFPNLAVARLARRHVTVALSGDVGDELFGGYHHYRLVQQLERVRGWRGPLRTALSRTLAVLPDHRAKLLAGALLQSDTVSLFHYLRSIGKDYGSLLAPAADAATYSSAEIYAQQAASLAMDLDPAETAMRLDLALLVPEGYLQKVDLTSMAFSLEARCPFADHRVIEWAMRLPLRYKIRAGRGKFLLKRVLERHLPAELVHAPKRGFVAPVAGWLRGPLRDWGMQLLTDQTLMSHLPLDRQRILHLWAQHATGRRNAQTVLWGVLMLAVHVAEHLLQQRVPAPRAARIAA